jgi:hypothetical protein
LALVNSIGICAMGSRTGRTGGYGSISGLCWADAVLAH